MVSTIAACVNAARAAASAGDFEGTLAHYEAALQAVPQSGTAAEAADILRWSGNLHREWGTTELAAEAYEASHAIAQASSLGPQLASALNCLAIIEQIRGNVEKAQALYREAGVLAEENGDERLAAMVHQNLGTLANIRGDVDGALVHYASALGHFERLGDHRAACWTRNNMGMAYVDQGEWQEAETCFDRAFDLAEGLRDTGLLGTIELNRAELRLAQRQHTQARECCDRAYEVFARLEVRQGLGEAHKMYGMLYREMGMVGLADTHFRQGVELANDADDLLLDAECHAEWALLHLACNRNTDALRALNHAHALFDQLQASHEVLDVDRRLDQLEASYLRVVQEWGESIESKDRYTAGHCQRVADYACMIAEALGFNRRDLTWLRMGGYLHDVGKTAVPEEVLNKPGALSDEEWALMRSHTTFGDDIVAPLEFPWDIRPVVRNHHERWDGKGYPDGLSGTDIPLTARILCVADVYDALTTARSYRPALTHAEAMRIMERDSGTAFDPEIFQLFQQLLEEKREQAGAAGRRARTSYGAAA
ncbi:MAG: HD domain-containing phosphohydrolase [Longimicrobiales bacterium]